MKKIRFLLVFLALFPGIRPASAQGYCVTSCAESMIYAMDSLFKGLNNFGCYTGMVEHRVRLDKSCSMLSCNSSKPRTFFMAYDNSVPGQALGLFWPTYTTSLSYWSLYGMCLPLNQPSGTPVDEYPYFVGDTTIGEVGCLENQVDGIFFRKIVNGTLQNQVINDIIEVTNPRVVDASSPFWQFINPATYGNIGSSEGVLVDLTVVGNYTFTAMLYHLYEGDYIEWKKASCPESLVPPPSSTMCTGSPLTMNIANPDFFKTYLWSFGDGSSGIGAYQSHAYNAAGDYTVFCSSPGIASSYSAVVHIVSCNSVSCSSCIGSFAPDAGDYIISLWVKEDNMNSNPPAVPYYSKTGVRISFTPANGYAPLPVYTVYGRATDPIIDGWQRIETRIRVYPEAVQMHVELLNDNSSGIDSYFDDIRVHPVDGHMKSYVYDPITLRLSAELDENNYATFYEYDEEGKLIRVKKETEKGVMTISETRSSIKKR